MNSFLRKDLNLDRIYKNNLILIFVFCCVFKLNSNFLLIFYTNMPPSASCARLKLSHNATMISPMTTSLVFIATRRRTSTPSCRKYLFENVLKSFRSNDSRVIRFIIFKYFFKKCSRLNGRICCHIHTRKPYEDKIETMTSQNHMNMKIFSLNKFTGSTH